jgi:retinol-binding protein 3
MKIKFITLSILFVASYVTVFGQFSPNQPDLQASSVQKAQIIDTIIKAVKSSYIFPEISLQIETEILKHQKRGDYNKIISSKEFADTISNQLVRISDDKHLRILFSYDTVPQKNR